MLAYILTERVSAPEIAAFGIVLEPTETELVGFGLSPTSTILAHKIASSNGTVRTFPALG